MKLLEADLKERLFSKLHQRCEHLEAEAGLKVSRFTVCGTLKRVGFA